MKDSATDKKSDERRKLVALADALFDDLMAALNDDILNDVTEVGDGVAAICGYMRVRFEEIENFITDHIEGRFEEALIQVRRNG